MSNKLETLFSVYLRSRKSNLVSPVPAEALNGQHSEQLPAYTPTVPMAQQTSHITLSRPEERS